MVIVLLKKLAQNLVNTRMVNNNINFLTQRKDNKMNARKMERLTKAQYKALNILKGTDYFNTMASAEFARRMWPDSNMHRKVSNQGHGATRGKAAWLCGGSYLAKLRHKGWVSNGKGSYGYYITQQGRKVSDEI